MPPSLSTVWRPPTRLALSTSHMTAALFTVVERLQPNHRGVGVPTAAEVIDSLLPHIVLEASADNPHNHRSYQLGTTSTGALPPFLTASWTPRIVWGERRERQASRRPCCCHKRMTCPQHQDGQPGHVGRPVVLARAQHGRRHDGVLSCKASRLTTYTASHTTCRSQECCGVTSLLWSPGGSNN